MALQMFEGNLDHFNPNNPYAGDDRLPVEFFTGAQHDPTASEKEGRPIFVDVDFIRIYVSKDEILVRPATESDMQRWNRQYQAWKRTGANTPGMTGTPLEKWPAVTRGQVEELKYFKIFTLEQLAETPENLVQKIPGFHKLKQMAKAAIEFAREEAPILRMQAELDKRDATIAAMQEQLEALAKQAEKKAK